jgi:mycothiol synthase
MTGVTWRAPTEADIPAWVDLLAAVESVDRTGEVIDAAEIEALLGLSYLDPAHDVRLGWDGDTPVGFASVLDPAREAPRRISIEGAVRPDRRRRGIGDALLEWAVGRAQERAVERPVDGDGWLEVGAGEGDTGREALFRAHGFAPVRYYFEMRRSLATAVAVPAVPRGLTLAPFDRARDEDVRAAHNEAFRDHWGSSPLDAETWSTWVTGDRDFRPDCSFIVLDGDDVAGYALNALHPADWPGLGFREGWTHQLGVRRPWRGRGVARALLHATMRAFRAEGMDYATLDVDSENPTGALALYQRAGYRRERCRVAWSRPL